MCNITAISTFLPCATPTAWIEQAVVREAILLIDHANCEKKAASTALQLLYRYVDKPTILRKMSRLAREELRHFEQVLAIMEKRKITYRPLGPSRYASGLYKHARTHEPAKLIDTLVIGAYIEARSCERFAALAPYVDKALRYFYETLLQSEARHFQDYLILAEQHAAELLEARIHYFGQIERELITSTDQLFRFHSGPLAYGAVEKS